MIPALAPLFQGPFAEYREVLVLADDPRPALSGAELVEPERLEALLARFQPEHVEGDRRALVSLWSKYYFLRLIPPVVAASLVLGWRLPLDFREVRVVIGDDGLPAAFKLPNGGERWPTPPGDPFARFAELLDDNLLPFIQALNGYAKVAPRVLWSNAGNYFEWILSSLAALPLPAQMLADGKALLETRQRPDGRNNPLFQPIRYVPREGTDERLRQRRQCCIRYLLPGYELCENCPHIDNPPPGYRADLVVASEHTQEP